MSVERMTQIGTELDQIISRMCLREKIVMQIVSKFNSDTFVDVKLYNQLVKEAEIISASATKPFLGTNSTDDVLLDKIDAWLTCPPSPIYASEYCFDMPPRSAEEERMHIKSLSELEPLE